MNLEGHCEFELELGVEARTRRLRVGLMNNQQLHER